MRFLIALAALAGCQGKSHDAPAPPPSRPQVIVDAGPPADANLDGCKSSLARIATLAPTQRAQALLDACHPCGDWQALLQWNNPPDVGGPPRSAIEQSMLACNAYCEPNAKQRFLGTLDAARGQDTRGPWRSLGEVCKEAVSAVPDTRFMGAPFFALDRISRAIADPALLAAIQLPLPALSISGVGVTLPVGPLLAADAGLGAITVDASQIQLGSLPIAQLTPTGLHVSGDYPGTPLDPKALAAALATPALAGHPVSVLAPRDLSAARIVDVIAAAGGHELRLAVGARGPGGWSIPGSIPLALTNKPSAGVRLTLDSSPDLAIKAAKAADRGALTRTPVTIALAPSATVANLASLLGALVYFDVKTVTITRPPGKPASKP
ncbi:MAG: hypothetical protein ABIY55_02165 [Kofleriaceae bacterium]